MSLETFCTRFPANPEVRTSIASMQRIETQEGKSLVAILAQQLAREGRDGIRETLNKYFPGNTMFELDQKILERIPAEDKQKMFDNYAAIVFGLAVVSLERTLVNGEYDHEDFCQRYNLATGGMQLGKAEAEDVKVEKLSHDQMGQMYAVIKKDKTFTLFFEQEGIQAAPHVLRQFLQEKNTILNIRKAILPLYKERARFLVL